MNINKIIKMPKKLKFVLDDEVRRVKFPPDDKMSWQFQDLVMTARASFPSIASGNFRLQYVDDEDERVTITNDSELLEALSDHEEMNKSTVRLFVVRENVEKVSDGDGGGQANTNAKETSSGTAPQIPSRCNTVDDLLSFIEHMLPVTLKNGGELRNLLSQLFNDAAVKTAVQAALETPIAQETMGAVTAAIMTGNDPIEVVTSRRQSLFPLLQNLLLSAPQLLQVVPHLMTLHAEWRSCSAEEEEQEQEDESPAVHTRVICDGCGCNPIIGIRYKCAVRDDFDLCESCESSGEHDQGHPMLKINTPAQAPAAIMVVLKEDQRTETEAETEATKAATKQAEFLKKVHDGSLTLAEAEQAGPRFMKHWVKARRKAFKQGRKCHGPHWRRHGCGPHWKHGGPKHGGHHHKHGHGHHHKHGHGRHHKHGHGRYGHDHGHGGKGMHHHQWMQWQAQQQASANAAASSASAAADKQEQQSPLLTPAALVSSLASTFLGCNNMQQQQQEQAKAAIPSSNGSTAQQVSQEEQQLLDAAIRDSLESLCAKGETAEENVVDAVKKAKAKLPVPAPCAFPHKAKFVADETEAAGVTGRSSTMKPSQSFTQRWRMVNSGDTAWSAGCRIKHVGADKLGHETGEKEISSGPVEPGTEIVIELPLVAPEGEGEYWSYWRMQTADGTRFGDRVWVHCFVNNDTESDSANWVEVEDAHDVAEDNVEAITMESIAGVEVSSEAANDDGVTELAEAAPAPSAPPDVLEEYQYAAQLELLKGMGFMEGVKAVLEQHNGDVGKTVNQLLQQ